MIRAPRSWASRMTSGPATTRLSLLAKATVLPASKAAQVPFETSTSDNRRDHDPDFRVAHDAGDPLGTHEQLDLARAYPTSRGSEAPLGVGYDDPAGPRTAPPPAPSGGEALRWAERATARNAPPEPPITSSVLRPILPVEPSMATFSAVPDMRRFSSNGGTRRSSPAATSGIMWTDLGTRPLYAPPPPAATRSPPAARVALALPVPRSARTLAKPVPPRSPNRGFFLPGRGGRLQAPGSGDRMEGKRANARTPEKRAWTERSRTAETPRPRTQIAQQR